MPGRDPPTPPSGEQNLLDDDARSGEGILEEPYGSDAADPGSSETSDAMSDDQLAEGDDGDQEVVEAEEVEELPDVPQLIGEDEYSALYYIEHFSSNSSKLRWLVKDWQKLRRDHPKYYSPIFHVGKQPWRLLLFPENTGSNHGLYVSLFLDVPNAANMTERDPAWQRPTYFVLYLLDQKKEFRAEEDSIAQKLKNKEKVFPYNTYNRAPLWGHHQDSEKAFNHRDNDWGFTTFMALSEFYNERKHNYLLNNKVYFDAHITYMPNGFEGRHNRAVTRSQTAAETPASRKTQTTVTEPEETGFVGLRNQGATCYMNSLLQTLFFLSKLRASVYLIPTLNSENGGEEPDQPARSIPLELQRIFHQLQRAERCCGTQDLTKSFGWDTYDAFMQHDVEEMWRVLSDNLEEKMRGTVVDGVIEKMFAGKMRNYIECINVPYQSTRVEPYHDLHLTVKGNPDVFAALDKYTEVETLDGENKYAAEGYGFQPARKGVRFESFPPVLQLHLMRFEYDIELDAMAKVNDRFEFPTSLDLSRYVEWKASHQTVEVPMQTPEECQYTLFSVMVHSGDTHGGHYYAFIRPFLHLRDDSADESDASDAMAIDGESPAPDAGETQRKRRWEQWYKFDDEKVTMVDEYEATEENFGVAPDDLIIPLNRFGTQQTSKPRLPHFKPRGFRRFGNAYMLVYIQNTRIADLMYDMSLESIPRGLRDLFESDELAAERRRKEYRDAHLYVKLEALHEPLLRNLRGVDLQTHQRGTTYVCQEKPPVTHVSARLRKEGTYGDLLRQCALWFGKELALTTEYENAGDVPDDVVLKLACRLRIWRFAGRINRTRRADLTVDPIGYQRYDETKMTADKFRTVMDELEKNRYAPEEWVMANLEDALGPIYRGDANGVTLYVEILPEPIEDGRKLFSPHRDDIVIYFKFYDRTSAVSTPDFPSVQTEGAMPTVFGSRPMLFTLGARAFSRNQHVQDLHDACIDLLRTCDIPDVRSCLANIKEPLQISMYEEVKPEMIDPMISMDGELSKCELQSGDIIVCELKNTGDVRPIPNEPKKRSRELIDLLQIGRLQIAGYYEYLRNQTLVKFEPLPASRQCIVQGASGGQSGKFMLALSTTYAYHGIALFAASVIRFLGLLKKYPCSKPGEELWEHIRLTPKLHLEDQPSKYPIRSSENGQLLMMLRGADTMYYEVLEQPLKEVENQLHIRIAYHGDDTEVSSEFDLSMVYGNKVSDCLDAVRKKMGFKKNVHLRMMEVFNHRIQKIFDSDRPLETFVGSAGHAHLMMLPYRVEAVPDSQVDLEIGIPGLLDVRLLAVQHTHCDSDRGVRLHGEPFLLDVAPGETAGRVLDRIRDKLQLAEDDFKACRLGTLFFSKVTLLEADDVVLDAVKRHESPHTVVSLALEHLPTKATRAATRRHQNRRGYAEKALTINN